MVALDVLDLLEQRLSRLEFHLGIADGDHNTRINKEGAQNGTAYASLANLQNRFKEICTRNAEVVELLKLYEKYTEVATLLEKQTQKQETVAPLAKEQIPGVLGSCTVLPQTISDLHALQRQRVPDSKALVNLASMTPRLVQAARIQQSQAEQDRVLSLRSAHLLMRWYEKSVLEAGQCWVGWEDRLSRVEMKLRREEHARSREEAGL